MGFTRNPNADQEGDVSLKEMCLRALKIVELQTKSQGIEVKLHFPGNDILVRGHLNMLAQGFKNILQNSIDRVTDRIRHEKGFQGFLDIEIKTSGDHGLVLVTDNGKARKKPESALGAGPFGRFTNFSGP